MVLTANPYRNIYNRREKRYTNRVRRRRWAPYGGVLPHINLRLSEAGWRGRLKKISKKFTKAVKTGVTAFLDGMDIWEGVSKLIKLVYEGTINMSNADYLRIAMSALTAMQDVTALGRWVFSRDPAPEQREEALSVHIRNLQEALAGRVRMINFDAEPTPDEAYDIYFRILHDRGEPDDLASIGANAVRLALAGGSDLPVAISLGTQAIITERQRRGMPVVGYGIAPPPEFAAIADMPAPPIAEAAAAADAIDAPPSMRAEGFGYAKLDHFFDWMLPALRKGLRNMRRPKNRQEWAIYGAQRGWTMTEFRSAYHRFLIENATDPDSVPPLILPAPEDYYEPYDPNAPYDNNLYQKFYWEAAMYDRGYLSQEIWDRFAGGSVDDEISEIEQNRIDHYYRSMEDVPVPPRRPRDTKEFCIMAAQRAWNEEEFRKGLHWYMYDTSNLKFVNPPPFPRPFGYNTPFNPFDDYDPNLAIRFLEIAMKSGKQMYGSGVGYYEISGSGNTNGRPATIKEFCIMSSQRGWPGVGYFDMGFEWWFYETEREKGYDSDLPTIEKPPGYDDPFIPGKPYDPNMVKMLEEPALDNYLFLKKKQKEFILCHGNPAFHPLCNGKYFVMDPNEVRGISKDVLVKVAIRDSVFRQWALTNGLLVEADLAKYYRPEIRDYDYIGYGILGDLFNRAKRFVSKTVKGVYNGVKKILS